MVIKEKEILGIVDQVQQSVESGSVPAELVPVDDLIKLMEATLGGSFWKQIGITSKEAFETMPFKYKALLEHCQEEGDTQGFILTLQLLKNQYRCTYAMLSKEELDRRTRNYKRLVLNIGEAIASVQYRLHKAGRNGNTGYPISFEKGNKGAVYTCLTGKNAILYQPEYINVYLDYICFTDKKEKWGTKEGIWEYREMKSEGEEESNSSMYYRYKMKPHELLSEYDYSIWVNAQMQITGEIEQLYAIYGENSSFLAFPAYIQDDLYEAVHTFLHTDDENIELRRKLLHYREEGFPEHFGLISTNLMLRNHRDKTLNKVMDTWWQESGGCEQLREFGFSYAAWKEGFQYALCDFFAEWNPYIKNVELGLEIND